MHRLKSSISELVLTGAVADRSLTRLFLTEDRSASFLDRSSDEFEQDELLESQS